jgi:hypothetical protein
LQFTGRKIELILAGSHGRPVLCINRGLNLYRYIRVLDDYYKKMLASFFLLALLLASFQCFGLALSLSLEDKGVQVGVERIESERPTTTNWQISKKVIGVSDDKLRRTLDRRRLATEDEEIEEGEQTKVYPGIFSLIIASVLVTFNGLFNFIIFVTSVFIMLVVFIILCMNDPCNCEDWVVERMIDRDQLMIVVDEAEDEGERIGLLAEEQSRREQDKANQGLVENQENQASNSPQKEEAISFVI